MHLLIKKNVGVIIHSGADLERKKRVGCGLGANFLYITYLHLQDKNCCIERFDYIL